MASNVGPPKVENYVMAEKLGSGSYADVYKAYRKSKTREVVAIKCVLKANLSKSALDNLISEIRILKNLNHEHIVEMKDFLWDDNYIFIIMEYCSGGDLSHFIKSRQRLPEDVCQRFLQQLASALQYMREKNISHFDLKPQNILLYSRKKNILKIADFGLAQPMHEDDVETKIKGSPLYMAPEILIEKKYNPKIDIWSVGVILYECLFGKAPYSSRTFKELIDKIITNKKIEIPINTKISSDCRDFLLKCLDRDVTKRIDFNDFFNHPFVDLEHKPSPENMAKATELLNLAVNFDTCKEYKEALNCYIEGLQYLVPNMHTELDAVKRGTMRRKIQEYLRRTEEVKSLLDPDARSNSLSLRMPSLQVTNTSAQREEIQCNLPELIKLVSTTPQIMTGIDIAQSAELYKKEGNYSISLEKYELSLGKLIPLLQNEPQGRRKDLLKAEISRWMKEAEDVKILSQGVTEETVSNEEVTPPLVADYEKSCVLQ